MYHKGEFLLDLGVSLLILSSLASSVNGQCESVCYPDLECFDNCPPYDFLPLPESPQDINTTFLLYTFAGQTEPEVIDELNFGSFNPTIVTHFIAHGFVGHPRDPWIIQMKEELLLYTPEPSNVVVIDWSEGANPDPGQPTEPIPAANSRVVARVTRNLVRAMQAQFGYATSQVHCVGHSVGGQLCGYFGQEFATDLIYRISGLDPAGTFFDTADPAARLSPDDAQFVDVIHTDTVGFSHSGTTINLGQVDFWPNGGRDQPGCSGNVCSHFRAQDYYSESINSGCSFVADKCSSLDDVEQGLCVPCSGSDCQYLGFHSIEYAGRGIYALTTNASPPYCIQ